MSEKPIAGDDKNADYKEVFSHWRHLVPVPPCPFGKSKTFAHAADVQERRKAMRVVTSDGVNVDPLQQEE